MKTKILLIGLTILLVNVISANANEKIKTCYVNTAWNNLNYFVFPNDGGKPYGVYVETLLSFTNKLNLDIEFIEEKKSEPYLDNCYKRMKNGEIDIISGLYDTEINRELMELTPTYKCPSGWNCKGNKHHNIGISKKSKYISRIDEFKSAALSSDVYDAIYNTKFISAEQHDWGEIVTPFSLEE